MCWFIFTELIGLSASMSHNLAWAADFLTARSCPVWLDGNTGCVRPSWMDAVSSVWLCTASGTATAGGGAVAAPAVAGCACRAVNAFKA